MCHASQEIGLVGNLKSSDFLFARELEGCAVIGWLEIG